MNDVIELVLAQRNCTSNTWKYFEALRTLYTAAIVDAVFPFRIVRI
jgi:hypothetical protein